MNTLAYCLGKAGYHEEALSMARQVVSLYRQLAHTQWSEFAPDLAMSQNNLAHRLQSKHPKEALEAAEESIRIYRQLGPHIPVPMLPEFATSLGTLARCLVAQERCEDALEVIHEGVAVRRRLAHWHANVHVPLLATTLQDLVDVLFRLYREADAWRVSQEAIHLYKTYSEERTGGRAEFEDFLMDIARTYLTHRHATEALSIIRELIPVYAERVANTDDRTCIPKYASLLDDAYLCCLSLNMRNDALKFAQCAATVRGCICHSWPHADARPALASTLSGLAYCCRVTDNQSEALEAAEVSRSIYEELVAEGNHRFQAALAYAWRDTATALRALGDDIGAAKARARAEAHS
ncbi:hypothetical protein HGRIS_009092 [Hohenbuehelia grisea]|uniref:Uncharacterized protein n=1 Tax=Hohenbuehelia grisea TaxID=104357 RepID=A0ABR3J065_9AGAR